MKVNKALITAAAPDQNTLPLQRLVDSHGVDRLKFVEPVSSRGAGDAPVL